MKQPIMHAVALTPSDLPAIVQRPGSREVISRSAVDTLSEKVFIKLKLMPMLAVLNNLNHAGVPL
jgi:hypothetical protein